MRIEKFTEMENGGSGRQWVTLQNPIVRSYVLVRALRDLKWIKQCPGDEKLQISPVPGEMVESVRFLRSVLLCFSLRHHWFPVPSFSYFKTEKQEGSLSQK